jgi:FAD/FMN-containing dehydrogenase
MYPSTLAKASVGGFLARRLRRHRFRDARRPARLRHVRAFEVVTMEEEPRVVLHEGAAVHEILHAWGTNGVLTRIWFALAPAVEWTQFTAAFDTYEQAFRFTQSIAVEADWTKRWPPSSSGPFPPSSRRSSKWCARANRWR